MSPGTRLRRSDPNGTGIRRRRCGRGFRYLRPGAQPVRDPKTLARIEALVIPPAWEDVWIDPALRDLGRNSEFGDLATRGAAERAVVRMLTRHG